MSTFPDIYYLNREIWFAHYATPEQKAAYLNRPTIVIKIKPKTCKAVSK
jgi:hypothetical protein